MRPNNAHTITTTCGILLGLMSILCAILGTFHQDAFYNYAYTHNGAYTHLGIELATEITENYQAYIDGKEELTTLFDKQQAAHLQDVKELYKLGKNITIVLLLITSAMLAILIIDDKRTEHYKKTLKTASITIITTIILLSILAINWEWFFTAFHKLFFKDNWTFSAASLMLRLWGGKTFIYASIWITTQLITTSALYILLASRLRNITLQR